MIVRGDARHIPLADQGVQCCITSPPYWGLRDYGLPSLVWGGEAGCEHEWTDEHVEREMRGGAKKIADVGWQRFTRGPCVRCNAWRGSLGLEPSPELYVAHLVEIFREVKRVLRDDGTCWLNLGDSYATGAGRVGDHPGGGEQGARWKGYRGERRAGKHAYLTDAMGPMTQPNRLPLSGLKPKDMVGIPWRVAFALQADGWWLRSDIIWAKPNPMPESVRDRPTKSHEYIFLLSKNATYYYDAEAIKEACKSGPSDIRKMEESLPRIGGKHKVLMDPLSKAPSTTNIGQKRSVGSPNGRNRRSVWTIATAPYPGAHFATFPETLVTPCILAGCPVGGIVLDPMCGSGTVEATAYKLGRKGIGMDLSTAYLNLSVMRARQTPVGLPLDDDRLPLAKGMKESGTTVPI